MSGPVRPPLTVEESDGSVVVRPANTIKFNEADFTVAASGATATISIDSTGAGAALTATHVGFGNASNLLTGSANFTFTDESGGNGPTVLLTGDKPIINIQDDTGGTDYFSELSQSGVSLELRSKSSTGGNVEIFRTRTDSISFIEDSAGRVGIGTEPDAGVERLHVQGTGTTDMVMVESTDAGSASAPDLVLYRNSASPADNDYIGRFDFRGTNSGGSDVDYTMITSRINDVSEDAGRLGFFVSGNAALNADDSQLLIFGRTGLSGNPGLVSINNSARSDVDFRVSGDTNANIIRTDASQDNLGIGTAPTSGYSGAVPRIHVLQPNDGIGILVEDNQADADVGPQIVWYRNSTSPAVDDILGRLRWEGKDSGGNQHMYGRQTNQIVSPTDGAESGRMIWESRSGGTLYETMRFEGNDITFNYAASNAVDLLIKGDNDNILFADASQDNLGIGTSAPSSDVERLHVKGTGTGTLVRLESSDTGDTVAPNMQFLRNSGSPAVSDEIGSIQFIGKDDGGNDTTYGQIKCSIQDETGGTEDGWLQFGASFAGTLQPNMLTIRGDVPEVVVNEGSGDVNFRVESNANTHMLFVDGGINRVSIGGGPTSGGATFQVPDNTISSYCNVNAVRSDAVATQAFTNADCQGQLWVNDSATDWTLLLPEGGIKGMWFKFVSTNGQMDLDPQGTDTVNGSTSTFSRDTNYEIYTVVCYDTGKWLVTNPN